MARLFVAMLGLLSPSLTRAESVCVTGASGFVAQEIVAQLLEAGFEVHGTVRSLAKTETVQPLRDTAKVIGKGKLVLHEADLLVEGAYDECVAGRDFVMHTAAAFNLAPDDIEKDLIEPAIRGTRNVLRSVNRTASVKRTVLTATMCSIWSFCGSDAWECPREQRPKNGVAFNEDDWATTLYPDGGLAYKDNQAYCRSKVEQEKAAREFADLNGLDLVTIHPALAVGPPRGPRDDGVSMYIMKAMAAGTLINPGFPHGDTRDVALAHIKAATIPEASGRYLVTTPHIPTDHELWTCLKQAYPAMELGSEPEVAEPHWFRASSKRTEELFGHALTPLCKSWVDAVGTIIQKGYAVNEGLKDLKSEL